MEGFPRVQIRIRGTRLKCGRTKNFGTARYCSESRMYGPESERNSVNRKGVKLPRPISTPVTHQQTDNLGRKHGA